MSTESGQPEVYVRPFPNVDDEKWQISTVGGGAPVWGPSGQDLFYQQRNPGDTTMTAVATAAEPGFTPGHIQMELLPAARAASSVLATAHSRWPYTCAIY